MFHKTWSLLSVCEGIGSMYNTIQYFLWSMHILHKCTSEILYIAFVEETKGQKERKSKKLKGQTMLLNG